MYVPFSGRSGWSIRSSPQGASVWVAVERTLRSCSTEATAGSAASRSARAPLSWAAYPFSAMV